MTLRCATCNGCMLANSAKGEPDACLMCGRTGVPTITPEDALALRKRELGGLGRRLRKLWGADWTPRRGRPRKVQAVNP